MNRPIVAITMGDPGGVGPEVIAKSLREFKNSEGFYYLLIGFGEAFEFLKEKLNLGLPLHPIPALEPAFLREDSVNFIDISEEASWLFKKSGGENGRSGEPEGVFDIGKVSRWNACLAYAALKVAAYQAATGLVGAVVTAPVNKTAIRLVDPRFVGHTEMLAKIAKSREYAMMFVGDRLKVTLVTIHVPLKKVSRLITRERVLEKIELTHRFLRHLENKEKPSLAVCALNPHGKETGEEDEAAIAPAVEAARRKKIRVVGPLSADQLFHEAYEGRFDAVISMYHDQGLAPFKMIAFRNGVNVTLGLPFVRTSPDHGTAFDIAYQGKANPESMRAALDLAVKLVTQKA